MRRLLLKYEETEILAKRKVVFYTQSSCYGSSCKGSLSPTNNALQLPMPLYTEIGFKVCMELQNLKKKIRRVKPCFCKIISA